MTPRACMWAVRHCEAALMAASWRLGTSRSARMRFCATLLLAATASGLRFAPMVRGPTLAARAAITMGGDGPVYVPKDAKGKTPKIPSGPFGGFFDPDEEKAGWVGDRSKSKQIEKFEKGSDYLFFQGPAPKTAIQEDVPNFFSPVCAGSNRGLTCASSRV